MTSKRQIFHLTKGCLCCLAVGQHASEDCSPLCAHHKVCQHIVAVQGQAGAAPQHCLMGVGMPECKLKPAAHISASGVCHSLLSAGASMLEQVEVQRQCQDHISAAAT